MNPEDHLGPTRRSFLWDMGAGFAGVAWYEAYKKLRPKSRALTE